MTEAIDWTARKHEASDRLEELRRERGEALLDGKPFDNQSIIEAEAALDALSAAEAGQETRARSAWAEREAERKSRLREQLESVLTDRTEAMNNAEKACWSLVTALTALFETSANACSIFQALDLRQPMHLNTQSVKLRAAIRIAAILRPVTGRTFGNITFPDAQGPILPDGTRLADSWSEADSHKIAAELAAALTHEVTQ
jgi:hypothetical protein